MRLKLNFTLLTWLTKSPETTITIPEIFNQVSCSFRNHHAKTAVKTGIRFTKTFVLATPIFRTTAANSTKAMTDAKTDSINSAPSDSVLTLKVPIVEKSVIKNVGTKKAKPITLWYRIILIVE